MKLKTLIEILKVYCDYPNLTLGDIEQGTTRDAIEFAKRIYDTKKRKAEN